MEKLSIKLVSKGTEGLVLLQGRLDTLTVQESEKIILDLVNRFDTLTLDMKDLEYLSSAGLRLLKQTYMGMKKKEGILQLKNVNKFIMEVFEMTGFVSILKII